LRAIILVETASSAAISPPGMERGIHRAELKQLGRYKTFNVLGQHLEFRDLFDQHPLNGVL
jgi:hypothetical protein